ncbi:MAG: NAD(P)/FAD-dependent oxidoreductase [archaeon]|nr:NAD(P)/FAD-dependent oxidoreductase [archaeon]
MHDVAIIGGGPAGSKVAAILAKNYSVLVLEEHKSSGTPIQCAGLVTERTINLSGVKPDILNRLYGAVVVFPNGKSTIIRSNNVKAVLISRDNFDAKMAEAAITAGAEYRYLTKYRSHIIENEIVNIETDKGKIQSKLIIGADGYGSKVAMSIYNNNPREYIRGIIYDIKNRMDDQDLVRIRIGSDVAPGLFSWEIPFGEFTRVGLCSSLNSKPPLEYLKVLIKRAGLQDKPIIAKYNGKIPVGGRKRSYSDHLLLIGDAAGQVKPISAGGLYPALSCANYLKETVDEAFRINKFNEKIMSKYEKMWKNNLGRELWKSYQLRKLYLKCTNSDMNAIYECITDKRINAILNDTDIDNPSLSIIKTLRYFPIIAKLSSIAIKVMTR